MTHLPQPQSAVARYTLNSGSLDEEGNYVESGLGLWLLLALLAPLTETVEAREVLEETLGYPAKDLPLEAEALLASLPAAVAVAFRGWYEDRFLKVDKWVKGKAEISNHMMVKPAEPQANIDAWVKLETGGLIPELPIQVGPDLALLFVSILATKISWETPFHEMNATRTEFPARNRFPGYSPENVLLDSNNCLFWETPNDGMFAVHRSRSVNKVSVLSVISEYEDCPPAVLQRVAVDVTEALTLHEGAAQRGKFVPITELPYGGDGAWTVTDQRRFGATSSETSAAYLPAWEIESKRNLLGNPTVAVMLNELASYLVEEADMVAVQACKASFTKTGFEAAAVTAFAVFRGASMASPGMTRHADVYFAHPYAFVAYVDEPLSPVHGLILFNGRVNNPKS